MNPEGRPIWANIESPNAPTALAPSEVTMCNSRTRFVCARSVGQECVNDSSKVLGTPIFCGPIERENSDAVSLLIARVALASVGYHERSINELSEQIHELVRRQADGWRHLFQSFERCSIWKRGDHL